ncbi:class I SAM-dependent methyltransferase [Uliginosibacterium sp. 31-16]|uniref:class I SAM-dependent methyltransferase n=1 Tax=Uliginosibacterium sp. 31-16 TaxID=3068315 RepID=UPI00273FDE51|nr:class I SAM-dependent methyltransferase [Uliginosibacterium sp. 31-16]MDP5238383.1 class I SAM-dependent methyltransferase [Uliginosibacterium sp. 31-16]
MSAEQEVVLEDCACPMGCVRADQRLFSGADRLTGRAGIFDVVQCHCCGLLRTNPRPVPESIGLFYPDDYGPYVGTRIVAPRQRSWCKRALIRLLEHNGERVPTLPPGRMLEVGCASGRFLRKMADQDWSVQGIEFSASAAAAARAGGFEVHAGSLEDAPTPAERFDLIVAWMVIEHLHDPLACLQKLREWSQPGAHLALSVPNAGALEFRVFKDRWYALQLPTHLYHFTPETMTALLEKAGWRVERILHQRLLTNLLLSLAYAAHDKGLSRFARLIERFCASRLSLLLHPLACLLALFGQTGRMTVWARAAEK